METYNNTTDMLLEVIEHQYSNRANYCRAVDFPWSTLNTILKRGVENTNAKNIFKICDTLHIEPEALYDGRIVLKGNNERYLNDVIEKIQHIILTEPIIYRGKMLTKSEINILISAVQTSQKEIQKRYE